MKLARALGVFSDLTIPPTSSFVAGEIAHIPTLPFSKNITFVPTVEL